jgi:hypothetical protein
LAYDPALLSFIIVGVVGGVAVVLNVSSDWEITRELARATEGWTAPIVVRRYRDDSTLQQKVAREAAVLRGHGYEAVARRRQIGDLDPGRAGTHDGPSGDADAPPTAKVFITYHLVAPAGLDGR